MQSPYIIFGQKFLGISSLSAYSGIQPRGGRGRISVSFADAELAGIVIALTFALNAWLVFLKRVGTKLDLGERLAKLQKYHVPGFLLVCYLLLTQSRGPMLALGAAFPILQIPRFKNPKLAFGLIAALLIVGAIGAKQYFSHYTEVKALSTITEEQSSVAYRQEMNIVYQSIAEMGGWLGWSTGAIPHIGGMKSIDNHFLLVHLMQGEFGYIVWILIVAESVRTGIAHTWTLEASEDRAFACSALAGLVIFWLSYYTCYMGAQLPQITFLLLGWSQSISAPAPEGPPKFAFRRRL
jgi:hypothetical protein